MHGNYYVWPSYRPRFKLSYIGNSNRPVSNSLLLTHFEVWVRVYIYIKAYVSSLTFKTSLTSVKSAIGVFNWYNTPFITRRRQDGHPHLPGLVSGFAPKAQRYHFMTVKLIERGKLSAVKYSLMSWHCNYDMGDAWLLTHVSYVP